MATLRKFIGKVPLVKRVTIQTRAGPREIVKPALRPWMRQESTAYAGKKENEPEANAQYKKDVAELAQEYAKEVDRFAGHPRSRIVDSARRMAEVLEYLAALPEKPHANEVLAGLAFAKGLEKGRLQEYANSLVRLQRLRKKLFYGSTIKIRELVNADILHKVDVVLRRAPKIMNPAEIAEKAGIASTKINRDAVATAVNVLSTMKLAQKQPLSAKGKSFRVVNAWYRHRVRSSPEENTQYQLMQALAKGPHTGEQLQEALDLRSNSGTQEALNTAISRGLATASRGRSGTLALTITELGKELLEEQAGRKRIVPRLRRKLLGEKNHGLTPTEEYSYQSLLRWARVQAFRAENPGLTDAQVAERMGEMKWYPTFINRKNWVLPVNAQSPEARIRRAQKLWHVMRERDPKLAPFLARKIEADAAAHGIPVEKEVPANVLQQHVRNMGFRLLRPNEEGLLLTRPQEDALVARFTMAPEMQTLSPAGHAAMLEFLERVTTLSPGALHRLRQAWRV